MKCIKSQEQSRKNRPAYARGQMPGQDKNESLEVEDNKITRETENDGKAVKRLNVETNRHSPDENSAPDISVDLINIFVLYAL